MTCPKCNEETIVPIKFRVTGDEAFLCENCETVWPKEEDIYQTNGHLLNTYEDQGYTYAYDRMVPEVKHIEEPPMEDMATEEQPLKNPLMEGGE